MTQTLWIMYRIIHSVAFGLLKASHPPSESPSPDPSDCFEPSRCNKAVCQSDTDRWESRSWHRPPISSHSYYSERSKSWYSWPSFLYWLAEPLPKAACKIFWQVLKRQCPNVGYDWMIHEPWRTYLYFKFVYQEFWILASHLEWALLCRFIPFYWHQSMK